MQGPRSFTIATVKAWDVVIIGAGIIGLSLAISLRKQGLRVLVIDRGEPGAEASSAAAGMLAPGGSEIPVPLRALAAASARLYPEFVHELEDESGIRVDFQQHGSILLSSTDFPDGAQALTARELESLEPALRVQNSKLKAGFMQESCVDPRLLVSAAMKAAHHRDVDIVSGSEVKTVQISDGRASGVETEKTSYAAGIVVNCAGAWAGLVGPQPFPVQPVKGQMVAVVHAPTVRHVIRSEKAYIVPRSNGRLVIGSTLENAGYDKQVEVSRIQDLLQAALELVPELEKARQHEAWAGLRPGTPDKLPILGETCTGRYLVATGHYRDGILLAPVTDAVMTSIILQQAPQYDVRDFSASRFA